MTNRTSVFITLPLALVVLGLNLARVIGPGMTAFLVVALLAATLVIFKAHSGR